MKHSNFFKGSLFSNWAIAATVTLVVTLFPVLFLYFNNVAETGFVDVIGVSLQLLGVAIGCFLIILLLTRDVLTATVANAIVMLFLLNFRLIEKACGRIFPFLYYWHIMLLGLGAIAVLVVLTKKHLNPDVLKTASLILSLVFGGLILLNSVMAVPDLVKKISFSRQEHQAAVSSSALQQKNPNFYYFLFDEYSGLDAIQKYCNYDNSSFYAYLNQLGFNTSSHSTNESISSFISIPNALNLDRVLTDNDNTTEEGKQYLKNPYLYQVMRQQGYDLNTMSMQRDFLDESTSTYRADFDNFSVTVEKNAKEYVLNNTFLYPTIKKQNANILKERLDYAFNYCSNASSLSTGNLFTLGYFDSPHLPWFLDATGSPIPEFERENWLNTDVYLGQFIYTTNQIKEMIAKIIKNDPESIIILQSDHAHRLPFHLYNYGISIPKENIKVEHLTMASTLNAVYFKGDSLDIEGLTNTNTLRAVLNEQFGMGFEMIPPDEHWWTKYANR